MKYNYWLTILLFLLVVLIIIINSFTKRIKGIQRIEGFDITNKWPNDLRQRFIQYQTTMNQNVNQYNLEVLQQQAGSEEVEQLLKTGFWPWSDKLKYAYLDKIWSKSIIKIEPQYALNYAMKIYNERAALELLSWNTKEGHFLLYGGDLGISDEADFNLNASLKNNVVHNTIKCSTDINGISSLQKKTYTGMNLWNGYMNSTTEKIKNENIPTEMPGFSFIKGHCNPCVALNDVADFSCPFALNVKGDTTTSSAWSTLWGL
jgi:hypothetical protein